MSGSRSSTCQLDQLLTPKEVARALQIEEQTLAVWRCQHRYNLPWLKIGSKIRYRIEDVQAYLEAQRRGEALE